MSVRAYNERRKQYRKTQGAVSNPGQPSPTNREARRLRMHVCDYRCGVEETPCRGDAVAWAEDIGSGERMRMCAAHLAANTDPDPPLKCWCGNCLPGQDRECPAKQLNDPRD